MKTDALLTINDLKKKIQEFVRARDWEQFHTPKNLSMAIAIEAAELMEEFRFQTDQEILQNLPTNENVKRELADITIAILGFCNLYGIDLSSAVTQKLEINAKKYPLEKAKGVNKKYTDY